MTDALLARLDRLEARNAALEAEVRDLRTSAAAPRSPSPPAALGRRQLLGTGLAAAGAAAAGAVLLDGRPAAAANGQALLIGVTNSGTATTVLNSSARGILLSTVGRAIDVLSDGEGMQIGAGTERALGAFTATGTEAVFAQTDATEGIGIVGRGKVGVKAEAIRAGGTGLEAISGQSGTAVVATSAAGAGVRGRGGTYGVIAQSTTTNPELAALYASSTAGMAMGAATDSGQVMRGQSGTGGGIEVLAPRFHLRLGNADNRSAPTGDTIAHARGDLVETTSGDLWLCTTGGTPGTWRKLAGPATAGAFHALAAPARVYDSRPGLAPTAVGPKTPFAAGTTRTFDLKANASGVPAGATAVMVNLLLVNATAGNGNLTIWANGTTKPVANTLVWGGSAGRFSTLAVTTVDPQARCQVNASLRTDLVIDVVGYYR